MKSVEQTRCPLCGGDHSKDMSFPVYLKCPYCGQVGEFWVMPECPSAVSHGEIHNCPNCGKNVFIVVYYDGEVFIQKARNQSSMSQRKTNLSNITAEEFLQRFLGWPKELGAHKEVHLSCGHKFRYEFSMYRKGQTTYCPKCKKDVTVVKLVDLITQEEYEIL